VAEFGGSSIPDIGFAKIGFDMRASTIELGQSEDGVEIIFLRRPAKIALGANEVLRQPVAGEPHESCAIEALRIVGFRRLLEIGARGLLVLRSAMTRQEDR